MPGRVGQSLLRLIVVLLAMVAAAPALAQSGLVGTPVDTCVAQARDGDTAAAMFTARDRYDCTTPQYKFGAGDFWVLSAPLSAHAAAIRMASLWQDAMTLHVRYADGATVVKHIDGHRATRLMQLGAMIELPLPPRASAVTRLLWHVEGAANLRGIVTAPRLASAHDSALANLRLGMLYAAFGGLCLALLSYNLALWSALRHPFQLAHCAMVASLAIYAFSSSGAMAWAWPWIVNNDRMRVNYLALAMSAVSAIAFARNFFEAQVLTRKLGRTLAGVSIVLAASALLFVTLAPWHIQLLDRLYALSFALLVGATVPLLWQAWRQRSNYLWLFAVAWAAPISLAGMRIAGNFHFLAWNFLIDNSTIVAMVLEALLSSMAIAYRLRLLARERDEARDKELAARLLADVDPLTGLLNRRSFLREAIGRDGPQLLILADIDHFKAVNEALGHDGGDEVLRIVTRALRAAAPPGALIARLGGEEFALLVPALATGDLADSVLARVRAQRMPFDLAVSVSIGACTGPLSSEQEWNLRYREADQALFAAKAAGRDRVRYAHAA